jgi:signal transduction histidine kinase
LGKSVITAQELLKNLLTCSREQRNALEYQPETLSAEIPLDMAIEECKPIAEGKNITISSSRDPGISVYADSNMLQTILRNLLVNAIKFSSVGGEIILKLTEENNNVHYSIEDFGTGMNEETVSSLFRIDERISTAGTNSEKGTGLGLILCKEFIDSHGGKIEVESQPGRGSRFTVILPGKPAA